MLFTWAFQGASSGHTACAPCPERGRASERTVTHGCVGADGPPVCEAEHSTCRGAFVPQEDADVLIGRETEAHRARAPQGTSGQPRSSSPTAASALQAGGRGGLHCWALPHGGGAAWEGPASTVSIKGPCLSALLYVDLHLGEGLCVAPDPEPVRLGEGRVCVNEARALL